jgi:hypothetical protein
MNQELFDLYTDYLISSFGPTTATGLARLLDGQVSHDQVTRLLAAEPQKSADLWRVVKPLVRQVECPEAVLSIDDSIGESPTRTRTRSSAGIGATASSATSKGSNS